MTKRRRIVWVIAGCLALAVCIPARLWLAKPGQVRLANHWGIRGGMTLAEVERVLGGPPGDYSSTPRETSLFSLLIWSGQSETWVSDEGVVSVHLDPEGRVAIWSYGGPDLVTPGLYDRLRAWLGW